MRLLLVDSDEVVDTYINDFIRIRSQSDHLSQFSMEQQQCSAAPSVVTEDTEQQPSDSTTAAADALPEEVLLQVFGRLPLRDLLHAAAACSHWSRCLAAGWRPRCLARWQHWTQQPARDAGAAAWREAYVRRHLIDHQTLSLLVHDACWPTKKAAAYSTIMAHGADVLDVLTTAANASSHSGLYVGLTHHALIALQLVQGQLAAAAIERVLAADAGASPGTAAAAAAAPPAQATAGVPGVDGITEAMQTGAVLTEQAAGSLGEDDVLEVALQLVQSLHPMCDLAAVRRIIDQLGQELTKRMAAGAAPGSRQALVLLNALLFGNPPPAAAASQQPEHAAAPTASGQTSTGGDSNPSSSHGNSSPSSSHSSSSSSRGPGGYWSSVWPRNKDLWGPDLSEFVVPTDGHSGLGLKGKSEAYQLANSISSSCLDSVLAARTGLPISLAVLHRAVGRRAGLDVRLCNAPGYVINRVYLHRAGSSGSSSGNSSGNSSGSGSGGSSSVVYVDAFAGTELDEAGFSHLWLAYFARSFQPSIAPADEQTRQECLPDMSAQDVCRRMLANLCHLSEGFLEDRGLLNLRCLYLSLPLVQLAAKFATQAFLAWGRELLVHQELLDFASMTQLYKQFLHQAGLAEILIEKDTMPDHEQQSQDNLAQPSRGRNMFWEKVCATVEGACIGAVVTARVSVRPYRESPCIVTWWGQDLTRYATNVARPRDELGVLWPGGDGVFASEMRGSPFADVFSRSDGPCGAHSSLAGVSGNAAWFASDGSCQVTQQAVELLRDSWFDPDFCDQLAALLRSKQQQLEDPELDSPDTWENLADIAACSQGLGFWFDAVWYDAADNQCVLVPNSYIRFRFPGS